MIEFADNFAFWISYLRIWLQFFTFTNKTNFKVTIWGKVGGISDLLNLFSSNSVMHTDANCANKMPHCDLLPYNKNKINEKCMKIFCEHFFFYLWKIYIIYQKIYKFWVKYWQLQTKFSKKKTNTCKFSTHDFLDTRLMLLPTVYVKSRMRFIVSLSSVRFYQWASKFRKMNGNVVNLHYFYLSCYFWTYVCCAFKHHLRCTGGWLCAGLRFWSTWIVGVSLHGFGTGGKLLDGPLWCLITVPS